MYIGPYKENETKHIKKVMRIPGIIKLSCRSHVRDSSPSNSTTFYDFVIRRVTYEMYFYPASRFYCVPTLNKKSPASFTYQENCGWSTYNCKFLE